MRYTLQMILSFKHKGLQKFYESGSTAGIQNAHKSKLRMILAALDSTREIDDMNIPGYKLHSLKGKLKGLWSVTVNGN
jgi:proteic killer suppression protein